MLVLSRRRDETILIGDDVEVVVLQTGPEEVKLGIRAPSRVRVYRKELYEQIAAQNRAAAESPTPDATLLEALRRRRAAGETRE